MIRRGAVTVCFVVLALAVAGVTSCARQAESSPAGPSLSSADSVMLLAVADSIEDLPARYDSLQSAGRDPDRNAMANAAWASATTHIRDVSGRTAESAEREWLIGQVMVSATHVDLHAGTFVEAERHLQRAMQLDSLFAAPRLALAQMYVNSDFGMAGKAEALLRGTHARARTPESLAIHEGLSFALYYQGQVRAAQAEAVLALEEGSQNGAVAMMARGPGR